MTRLIASIFSALLLALTTVPALAFQADSAMWVQPVIKLAQLSPNERRALRERWEQASPEERIQMRQFFQDRMRQMSPFPVPNMPLPAIANDAMRLPFTGAPPRESYREREDDRQPRGNSSYDGGFGFGFEKRRSHDDDRR